MILSSSTGVPALPGDAVMATFLMIFLLTTSMAAQSYKKLCYVERGCNMYIQFVSAWFVLVWVKKLYTSVLVNVWQPHHGSKRLLRHRTTIS